MYSNNEVHTLHHTKPSGSDSCTNRCAGQTTHTPHCSTHVTAASLSFGRATMLAQHQQQAKAQHNREKGVGTPLDTHRASQNMKLHMNVHKDTSQCHWAHGECSCRCSRLIPLLSSATHTVCQQQAATTGIQLLLLTHNPHKGFTQQHNTYRASAAAAAATASPLRAAPRPRHAAPAWP